MKYSCRWRLDILKWKENFIGHTRHLTYNNDELHKTGEMKANFRLRYGGSGTTNKKLENLIE